ncbi:LysE family translocator [Pseudomonas veronii]|uniref:LysE family translocator n=1 Tax=Pseudomonas veronii TaxID=76761 RepID=A0A7Y1FBL6_PSEVE|nr:LysE family translocator [Pseudomonas veronii]NMY11944.1 LysE family translocator [Pseudomonas veronii]
MAEMAVYLIALAVVYLLPGPDMILLLQTGARQGRDLALATAIGLALARSCHVTLAAVGLATLFRIAPWTFDVVRLTGAAYLFWLGIKLLKPGMLGGIAGSPAETRLAWREAIQRGLLTNLLNPKALLFCSVLLPQFIDPQGAAVSTQFVFLGMLLVAVGLVFDSFYAVCGSWIGRWLERSPGAQKVQQWIFGGLLIGFALRMAFIQQR